VRSRFYVSVNAADIEPARLRELVDEAEVKVEKIGKPGALGVYTATVADDLLGAERLRHVLRRNGVESFMRHERSVSNEELAAAPLAVLRVERAERGHGGPTYGTAFALESACPRCGTGAVPAGDIFVKSGDVPKRGDVFQTLDHEHFVSARLREALVAASVTGGVFHDVRDARSGDPLPWSRLIAPFTLPRFDTETSGGVRRQDPCAECGRDGYFETAQSPLELRYSLTHADLDRIPDFASTWEHFGISRLADPFEDSVFAQPLLVVGPRVVELLRGIRGLAFDPVAIAAG
jgi:hypothetical protein